MTGATRWGLAAVAIVVVAVAALLLLRRESATSAAASSSTAPGPAKSVAAADARRLRPRANSPSPEPGDGAGALTPASAADEVRAAAPGDSLDGVVVDDLGASVEGATITSREGQGGPSAPARSRADGTFRLTGLSRGDHRIEASLAGHVPAKTTVEPGVRSVQIVLAREARLRFRLRLPLGSPKDVAVWWGFFDERGSQCAEDAVRARLDQLDMDVVAPAVARRMRIDVRDHVPVWLEVRPVPATTSDLGEIAIDAGRALEGRVTGPDGRTPPNVRIHVWDDAKSEILLARHPAADGSFALPGVPRARVLVEFEAEGFVPVERRFDAATPGESLVIAMVRGALVRVHVLGVDGKDADWCGLDVLDERRAPTGLSLRSKWRGDFTGRLPAGRYLLVASREEGEAAERCVDVDEGGTLEITLQLAR